MGDIRQAGADVVCCETSHKAGGDGGNVPQAGLDLGKKEQVLQHRLPTGGNRSYAA